MDQCVCVWGGGGGGGAGALPPHHLFGTDDKIFLTSSCNVIINLRYMTMHNSVFQNVKSLSSSPRHVQQLHTHSYEHAHSRLFHSIEKLDIRSRPHSLLGDRQLNPSYRIALECSLSFFIRTT